jgi:hypothetical protein
MVELIKSVCEYLPEYRKIEGTVLLPKSKEASSLFMVMNFVFGKFLIWSEAKHGDRMCTLMNAKCYLIWKSRCVIVIDEKGQYEIRNAKTDAFEKRILISVCYFLVLCLFCCNEPCRAGC